ncbi:NAD(P)/FAD-dependent oxidoreductase [Streptomyces sp. AS02]|uniref:NAD(P)/FAD-dependent oxidoreductase n=1 Tax=Streptomyces sp. AS02 TaxID=2938946 RepID=UPI002021BE0D|nr:NAD(P)/FAD-dependent oxidoreductase [Streptomyces sp. AS02]MCL8015539.1 NAD(P)/FAD-dependent oxidoreductase [Streptomyces sp. AS02]
MPERRTEVYDVVINGASVAGCAAAILYARRGARVALLERRSGMSAHKVLCTHYIQASAYPVMAELGLAEALDGIGAVRNSADYWTKWGWIKPEAETGPGVLPHGYSVRRESLDPLLRRMAAGTPGVDLKTGHTVNELIAEGDRVVGVAGTSAEGTFAVRAELVVGADGKDSTVARLAGAPAETADNNRFSYFAYFRGIPHPEGRRSARVYYLDPDNAYVMPNEDGVTVIAAVLSKARLDEFRDDIEGAYRNFVRSLPEGPDIDKAEMISKVIGTLNYPLISRRPSGAGYALIGDAALTSDPLSAVGCAWAMQSASWLVGATSDALLGNGELDTALTAYTERHAVETGAHHHLIADYAQARPFNEIEAFMFEAAARDSRLAQHFHTFGSRLMTLEDFMAPDVVAHAEKVNGWSLSEETLRSLAEGPPVAEAHTAGHGTTSAVAGTEGDAR